MIEMVIWLVVIAAFVFRALKKNGTLDELFAGAKKRKENKAERVVYEQPEEGSGKKEKKKGPGIRVPKHTGLAVTAVVIVLAAAVLSFDSFYTLSEEEMAVVTTFGKPAVEEASGLHFKIPVIQRVTKVSKAITGMQIGYTTDPARADGASIDNPVSIENESLMITKDFNLTNVDFYVEYMVTDPVQAVRHRSVYESIIKNLAQSYIRDTVGVYNVDDVITTGKTQIQERIKEQLTNRLVEENIGYGIYNVSIQDTEMPRDDVANAFKAVEDAKQGMETAINSAKKYQSENIPEAKAKADKLLQDAEAYKEQRINEANGQVARFEDTYAEYVKYPLITKKRMFYETMEEVLPDLKVIITGGNGTQTLLPLEPFSEAVSGSAAQTGGMKKTGKRIIGIVVLLLIVVLLQGSMVSTYNDEYKLILQFGKVVRVVETPGLSFKIPFLQTTQSIPNYEMIYDLIPSEVNTRDKKVMVTDSFALWSVTDPLAYLSRLGANKANAESRISVVVYNAVKNVISSTDQADVISGRDGKLAEMITEKIGSSLDSYGIKVKKVETKLLDLPDSNKEAVYQRMISERQNIAAGYIADGEYQSNVIKNSTDKEVSIIISEAQAQAEKIRAEGEAEYMRILSGAYNDEGKADYYNYIRSLDALKASLKGDNKTIILDENSELAKILRGNY